MIVYRQNDPRYASDLVGYNIDRRYNMASFGCLVTSQADMLATVLEDDSITPGWLNKHLQAHGGFTPSGGLLIWSAIPRLFPFIQDNGATTDIRRINEWLADGTNYCMVEVSGGAHWVFGYMQGMVNDPLDGRNKPFNAYKIKSARLYRFVGGKGGVQTAAALAPPTTNNQEPLMTADQEREAYRIVLNREPEGPVPTGRSGMAFIMDAKGELEDQRQAKRDHIDGLTRMLSDVGTDVKRLNEDKVNLQATIDELQRQAETITTTVSYTATPPDFRTSEIPEVRTRVAARDGASEDFVDGNSPKSFIAGTIFHQASTVEIDGAVYIRTQRAVDNNSWYLTSQEYFDDVPASRVGKTTPVHVLASMVQGIWLKLRNRFTK